MRTNLDEIYTVEKARLELDGPRTAALDQARKDIINKLKQS